MKMLEFAMINVFLTFLGLELKFSPNQVINLANYSPPETLQRNQILIFSLKHCCDL